MENICQLSIRVKDLQEARFIMRKIQLCTSPMGIVKLEGKYR